MDIIDFFSQISSVFANDKPVIYFAAEQYQPFFLDTLKNFIEKNIGKSVQKINLDQSLTEITMQLSTTFLGQINWYMVENIELITASKKKSDFIQFIKNYKGPHRLIVFLPSAEIDQSFHSDSTYSIANNYTYDQVRKMSFLYDGVKPEIIAYFYNKIFAFKKEFSLDQLCLLKEYALLLGNNHKQFFDEWIEKLVFSDISLFYMSQIFFEKNGEKFFIQWHKIKELYSDQFWTVFFSDLLFKSYFYVQHKGMISHDQKSLTFGLPYSFLKHDWKMFKMQELQQAHQRIYEIDLSLKRNGSLYQLDVFCMSFFNGDFV